MNTMAKINMCAIGTWLEPYIGFEFKVISETRKFTMVDFYGEPKRIENQYLSV